MFAEKAISPVKNPEVTSGQPGMRGNLLLPVRLLANCLLYTSTATTSARPLSRHHNPLPFRNSNYLDTYREYSILLWVCRNLAIFFVTSSNCISLRIRKPRVPKNVRLSFGYAALFAFSGLVCRYPIGTIELQ